MMKRIWAGLAFLAVFVLAGIVTFQLVGCSQTKSSKNTGKNKPSVEKGKSDLDSLKSLKKAIDEMMAPGWHYVEEPDKMGRGSIKRASTFSLNTVSFGFPYEGEQHGILMLRSHPKLGKDVMLAIEKGQFLTGVDGCAITVRFDNDNPMNFGGTEPSDHSTTMIFISGYSKFVTKLLKAKKVMIEAPFYQEGNQIFEFKVDSLVWSNPPPPPLSLNEKLKREYRAMHPE